LFSIVIRLPDLSSGGAVTFVIVVFCEVLPKYMQHKMQFVRLIEVHSLFFALDKILRPLSALLIRSTSFVDRRVIKRDTMSRWKELTHAIDITSDKNTPEGEKKILKGIAKFGNMM